MIEHSSISILYNHPFVHNDLMLLISLYNEQSDEYQQQQIVDSPVSMDTNSHVRFIDTILLWKRIIVYNDP